MVKMWHFLLFFFSYAVTEQFDFFQLFSTVLKRLCPLDSKNVFALALAHLEPELEPFSHSRAKKNKKNATFDHFPRPGEIDP